MADEARRGRPVPFAQVPHELIDDPDVSHLEIAVYCVLRRFCDFGPADSTYHFGAHPGSKTAAMRAGMTRPTFRKARERLEKKGWVSFWKRPGKAHLYVVHGTPASPEEIAEQRARWEELRGDVENPS